MVSPTRCSCSYEQSYSDEKKYSDDKRHSDPLPRSRHHEIVKKRNSAINFLELTKNQPRPKFEGCENCIRQLRKDFDELNLPSTPRMEGSKREGSATPAERAARLRAYENSWYGGNIVTVIDTSKPIDTLRITEQEENSDLLSRKKRKETSEKVLSETTFDKMERIWKDLSHRFECWLQRY